MYGRSLSSVCFSSTGKRLLNGNVWMFVQLTKSTDNRGARLSSEDQKAEGKVWSWSLRKWILPGCWVCGKPLEKGVRDEFIARAAAFRNHMKNGSTVKIRALQVCGPCSAVINHNYGLERHPEQPIGTGLVLCPPVEASDEAPPPTRAASVSSRFDKHPLPSYV